jgi:hypothetical protein
MSAIKGAAVAKAPAVRNAFLPLKLPPKGFNELKKPPLAGPEVLAALNANLPPVGANLFASAALPAPKSSAYSFLS